MTTLTLKVKSKSGQHILKEEGLSLQSKLGELKSHLSKLTQISAPNLQIRIGFPPAIVSQNDGERLENLGIKNGETLIVEEIDTSAVCNGAVSCGTRTADTAATVEAKETIVTLSSERSSNQESQGGGVLLRQVVPSDNSCLFTSIGYVLNGKVDTTAGNFMRQIIAETITNNKEEYCDAILGKPNEEYAAWILKPDSWGGAIELSILANVYGMEIAVIDTMNQIINRFGEDQRFPHRVYLIFDGIHYDPIYMEPLDPSGKIQTIFPSSDESIYRDAELLAKELKQSKQYTDVARFTLKCLECGKVLTGQAEATQHAKSTGHAKFDECKS